MATLTRTYSLEDDDEFADAPALPPGLTTNIPAPFNRELLEPEATTSHELHPDPVEKEQTTTDLHPSIALVQRSCITTLNNLLSSQSSDWQAIVPDRRHSMPNSPAAGSASTSQYSQSSALTTLLTNLRNIDSSTMIEVRAGQTDSEMLTELDSRIQKLPLSTQDNVLATAIVLLLRNFDRLSQFGIASSSPSAEHQYYPPPPTDNDLVTTLRHFQRTTSSQSIEGVGAGTRTPVQQVEAALLWSNIEHELEHVAVMCKERNHTGALPPQYIDDHHDPFADHDLEDDLPEYEHSRSSMSFDDRKSVMTKASLTMHGSSATAAEEKMRLDLESVTMAIDRLYMVAPQLANQRVELRDHKRAEMERATKSTISAVSKGKAKENDMKDLQNIIELLDKASQRKFHDQSFVMDANAMKERLEKARMRDDAKRAEFMNTLALHSSAGRLHNQDSLPPSSRHRLKNPETMLSLPEFIRESLPKDIEQQREDERMMTLPEFVREPPPSTHHDSNANAEDPTASSSSVSKKASLRSLTRSRSKSLSSFPWLKHRSASGSGTPTPPDMIQASSSMHSTSGSPSAYPKHSRSRSGRSRKIKDLDQPPSGSGQESMSSTTFSTTHLAEAHHSLRHVLVFVKLEGSRKEIAADVEGEVVQAEDEKNGSQEGGTLLLVRYGTQTHEHPIELPARCVLGKEEVKVRVMSKGTWFEVRVGMVPQEGKEKEKEQNQPLLDASQLNDYTSKAFICASCSLPLLSIASPEGMTYRDLPSEHWEELLDAWMCHSSQKLNDEIADKSRRGFIPTSDEAFVGKTFLLVDQDLVVRENVHIGEDKVSNASQSFLSKKDGTSQLVRCLCGSLIGRCQRQTRKESEDTTTVYRLLKFAMRPVGNAESQPVNIPLSSYLIHDMLEYVDAHASYRFVLMDEEEELPRMLLWLFKPSLHISYAVQKSYAIPNCDTVHSAKVLFKALTHAEIASGDLSSLLSKYPMFPAAEYLYYPMTACERIATLLTESCGTYPEGMRTMTGLEVGWLSR
ncbi:HECT-like ubiquitin-conjugating enzyme-binding-domain-containing protein [Flagelloscypha sp. PMI_526]|nr:HECT-like ubiquitin-conjugating enzyme-binding-domain-containing protein [Flagelloscypha sp. PMI_526]